MQLNSQIFHKKLYMNYWIGIIECHQGLHYYRPPTKGKAMFSQVSVNPPPGPYSPEPKKRAVRILLECFLVTLLLSFWLTVSGLPIHCSTTQPSRHVWIGSSLNLLASTLIELLNWNRQGLPSRFLVIHKIGIIISGPSGGGRYAPPVQFVSFSCSFQQKSCQTIGFHPKLRPRLGNLGSATDYCVTSFGNILIIVISWINYNANLHLCYEPKLIWLITISNLFSN